MWHDLIHGLSRSNDAVDRLVLDVGRVRVPRHADRLVAAGVHDGLHVLRDLRDRAVDLDPDFDAGVRRGLAALDERLADLLERLLRGRRPSARRWAGPSRPCRRCP